MTAIETTEVSRGLDVDGYCVIRNVVSPNRLADYSEELLEAYRAAPGFQGGGSISGHLNCLPGESARFIVDEIEDRGIREAVHAACPELPRTVRATMNYNLPGSIAQHYHMDGIYTRDYIICNVAVVDTDLLNGAIDLLPTTHREFYPFWRYALERKYRLTTRVPMAQGDVLLRRSTLWHRGTPNRTTVPRPMFSLTVGERIPEVEDPILCNPSEIQFYANWYGTSRLGVVRERVEVALPITRSVGRFARSLGGRRGYSSY
ncbi:MAG: phytanoyl-CoA dioxygenase family protein [Acidimicrobiaceae bacterium]|nr:phytanoyl-CoA dioxygenase family protein [Acidimicrobiaceae bacterium]